MMLCTPYTFCFLAVTTRHGSIEELTDLGVMPRLRPRVTETQSPTVNSGMIFRFTPRRCRMQKFRTPLTTCL